MFPLARAQAGALGLLAALLLPAGDPAHAEFIADRQQAVRAYAEAEKMDAELHALDESAQTETRFLSVIRKYKLTFHSDPAYHRCDDALLHIAKLYREMGDKFRKRRYYELAIRTYNFLISDYPASPYVPEAMLEIGNVYADKLANKQLAIESYQSVVKKHPRSPHAAVANERLAELLKGQQPEAASSQAELKDAPSEPDIASLTRIAKLTGIRHWPTRDYTRVVIDLDGEVKFSKGKLSNPSRLYFDLLGARLGDGLAGRSLIVEDAFLKRIRVAENRPNVVRVVLDFADDIDYNFFALYNPFRIVVDIRGLTDDSKAASAKSASPLSQTKPTAAPQKPIQAQPSAVQPAASSNGEAALARPEAAPAGRAVKPEPSTLRQSAPTSSGTRTLTRTLGLKISRVVIDPGHGGWDTGTISPGGLMEKDVVLDIARRLQKHLTEKLGLEVFLTRTEDVFVPLEERTAIANAKGADLFISIHANSSRNRQISGIETFYLSLAASEEEKEVAARENAPAQKNIHELEELIKKIALGEKVTESREFATIVQQNLHKGISKHLPRARNRGVKRAPFIVLIGANMPSILTEVAFLSNPKDERFLAADESREHIARALTQGIEAYVKSLGSAYALREAGAND